MRKSSLLIVTALALGLLLWSMQGQPERATEPVVPGTTVTVLPEIPVPQTAPPQLPPRELPTYLRHFDPAMEICRRPTPDAKSLVDLMPPGSGLERYLKTQTEDLRNHVLDVLSTSQAAQPRMAAALLRGDIAAAADIARATEDGKAYGIAWQACQARGAAAVFRNAASAADAQEMQAAFEREMATASPSCDALTVERWAQLEPDNAAPWLQMLSEARERGDRAAAIDALYRAGQARRQDTGFGWLTGQVAAALPADVPEGGRMMLLTDTIGRDAARPIGMGPSAVSKACSVAEAHDSNTRQQCEQVAQLLMDRSATLFDRAVGTKVAERLGLDADRIAMSSQALNEVMIEDGDQFTSLLEKAGACAALRELGDRLADRGRLGEWGAIQARRPRGKS